MPESTKIDTDTAEATAESLDRLTVLSQRRSLMRAASQYYQLSQKYSADSASRAVVNAHVGLLMASTYAYSLAALMGIMAEEMSPEDAADAAVNIDDAIINGDDGDLNADVMPEGAEKPPAFLAGVDNDDRRIAADLVYQRERNRVGPDCCPAAATFYSAAELLELEKAADQSPERCARIEALAHTADLTITFATDPPLRDLRTRIKELEREVETLRAHNAAAAKDGEIVMWLAGERDWVARRAPEYGPDMWFLGELDSVHHWPGGPPQAAGTTDLTWLVPAAATGCDRHGPDKRCVDCASEEEILAAIPPHGVAL